MRALVLFECSGRVRSALRDVGVEAWSVDLQPPEDDSPHHIQGDAMLYLHMPHIDLIVAHPPCTYLSSVSAWCLTGNCRHKGHQNANYGAWRLRKTLDAIEMFQRIQASPVRRLAIENPQMSRVPFQAIGPPAQYVHPWWFGDPYTKRTGWWLKGLPPLTATNRVEPLGSLVAPTSEGCTPGVTKWTARDRSRTPAGMAQAIARQWGDGYVTTLF